MKIKYFLLFFLASLHLQFVFSQNTLKYREIDSAVYKKLLSSDLKNSRIFELSTPTMLTYLHNEEPFVWQLGSDICWHIRFEQNNFLLQNTHFRTATRGSLLLPPCQLFRGETTKQEQISLTIDSSSVYATISSPKQGTYLIQPLQDFIPTAPSSYIVLYKADDIITSIPLDCATKDSHVLDLPNPHAPQQAMWSSDTCSETITLTLLADYSMLQKHQTPERLAKYLITLLHGIESNYAPLHLQFALHELYVIDCSDCNYFSDSTNPNTRLDSFRDWANATSQLLPDYHVAQLWTNEDLDGTVIGLSYINGICTNNKYSLVQDVSSKFQAMRMLMAHELGHSLGANHDPFATNYIMRPVISATATEFSPTSTNDIGQTVAQRNCLHNCTTCHATGKPMLFNRLPNSTQITWTPSEDANNYAVALRPFGTNNAIDSLFVSDTTCTFFNLNPCLLYEAFVYSRCTDNDFSVAQKLLIQTATIAANLQKIDEEHYQLLAYNNNLPVQVLFRETASGDFILNSDITEFPYNLPAVSPCKNYEIKLQYHCDSLIGGSTTLSIPAVGTYGLITQKQNATTIGVAFFTTNTNYDFRAQITKVFDNSFILDTVLAPTSLHHIGNLKPCTSYELAILAQCPNGDLAPKRSTTFTTADLAWLQNSIADCDADNQNYQAQVQIGHNHLDSEESGFTVWLNNTPYLYNYSTSPQTIAIPQLPANHDSVLLTVTDNHFPDECRFDTQYLAPPAQCDCSLVFFENFENCTLPNAWLNTALGANWQAKWQVGNAPNNKNLDGTCMAFFDDDSQDTDGGETVLLESPAIDLTHYTDIRLRFDYNFHTINGDFWIDIWNGSQWIRLADANGGNCGAWDCDYPKADFDITAYKNNQFKIRFIYTDGDAWDWYVGVDNIEVCAYPIATNCLADFYYPNGNTYCAADDFPSPVISGMPRGNFTATPNGLTIDPITGLINTATSLVGNYTVQYTAGNNACSSTQNIHIRTNCYTTLRAKVFLQGSYNVLLHQQNTTLLSNQLLPLQQPYYLPPFYHFGSEKITNINNFPLSTVDWLLLELREPTNPTQIVATKAVLLLANGSLTDADNPTSNSIKWYGVPDQAYLLSIKHRNHLAIQSSSPINLPNATTYNFTNALNKAAGIGQQATLESNVFGMHTGDIDANQRIQIDDYNQYMQQTNFFNLYTSADLNLDGNVNLLDYLKLKPNVRLIGFVRP